MVRSLEKFKENIIADIRQHLWVYARATTVGLVSSIGFFVIFLFNLPQTIDALDDRIETLESLLPQIQKTVSTVESRQERDSSKIDTILLFVRPK